MKPTLLALDPGVSTGWAVFWPNGITQTGTIRRDQLVEVLKLLQRTKPENVVIELLPYKLTPTMRQIESECITTFPDHERVAPAVWKTVSKGVAAPIGAATIHERDAYRMGRYWLRFKHAS